MQFDKFFRGESSSISYPVYLILDEETGNYGMSCHIIWNKIIFKLYGMSYHIIWNSIIFKAGMNIDEKYEFIVSPLHSVSWPLSQSSGSSDIRQNTPRHLGFTVTIGLSVRIVKVKVHQFIYFVCNKI